MLALAGVGGCTSYKVPSHRAQAGPMGQGSASELVFSGPQVIAASTPDDWEYARRDAALGYRERPTALQAVAFPGDPAPDLALRRWLYLGRTAEHQIYFDRERPGRWDWPTYDVWP